MKKKRLSVVKVFIMKMISYVLYTVQKNMTKSELCNFKIVTENLNITYKWYSDTFDHVISLVEFRSDLVNTTQHDLATSDNLIEKLNHTLSSTTI